MFYLRYMLLLLAVLPYQTLSLSRIDHCIQKIKSYFQSHCVEKIDHKELSTDSLHSVSICNQKGPITIKTGWKKKYLCLNTVTRAKNKNALDAIKIIIDTKKPHHLAIDTQYSNEHLSGTVEYELIIPTELSIHLITKKGDIFVSDISGNITLFTQKGKATIVNTKNNITIESCTDLYIENATGAIKALAHNNITIEHAHNNITATTKKGKINIHYKDLSAADTVSLSTESGTIFLTLPLDSHATIHGLTAYGSILCEHYITLQPLTTQLNTLAWNKLKKEVHGTINEGRTHISLSSLYGDIKILQS